MPDLSTPTLAQSEVTFTLIDAAGYEARAGVKANGAFTGTIAGDLRAAIANSTNAALTSYRQTGALVDNPNTRATFDEAYASVANKLVLVYQNSTRMVKRFELPAPDASLFGPDGRTIDLTNAQSIALVTAVKAAMDVSGGPWVLTRGYLISRTRTPGNVPALQNVTLVEPTAGQLPPPAPGT